MKKRIHPYLLILISFLGVILIGAILLCLPFSSTSGQSMGFVNALFMATSSVCVTGLSVMENGLLADLTNFGKIIMVILMEIGGLSFITIAIFFFTVLGGKIGISDRFILKEALNQNTSKGILDLVKRIVTVSITIQLIGMIINCFPLYEFVNEVYGPDNAFWKAVGMSAFHSAASFNNAGFDIFGNNSMELFASNAGVISNINVIVINVSTILMIVIGGIGFTVLSDVIRHRKWKKLALHTKITVITTGCLIVFGTLLIKLTSEMPWLESLFTAVTSRTAGFATYNISNLENYPATYLIVIVLMFIGASPCSTGGGIKTTTFAILVLSIIYFAKGKKTKAFNRSIGSSQIFKAYALMGVAIMLLLVGTIVVSATQPELGIDKIFFEVVSAFSTTGLSMGITVALSSLNKVVLCFLMFFGRLGPLTVIGLVNKNISGAAKENIKYIEERVIIG